MNVKETVLILILQDEKVWQNAGAGVFYPFDYPVKICYNLPVRKADIMCQKYTADELNSMNHETKNEVIYDMQNRLDKLEHDYENLIEQIRLANHERFGRHSETLESIDEKRCGNPHLDFMLCSYRNSPVSKQWECPCLHCRRSSRKANR